MKIMHNLKWNEYDFVECLGALVNFDEDSVLYTIKTVKDDLTLEIVICHYESLVQISLSQKNSDKAFFKISFLVRNEIRYVNEKNSSFLEFSDCIVANCYESELFDKKRYSTYSTFQIFTFPKFQLNFS